ncbi:MAG: ROK family protein [Pseudomonadota bacterium]
MNREIPLTDAPLEGCGPHREHRADATVALRRRVYESVRSAGQISRVDLARHLDVSPASVTLQTADLLRDALLEEVEAPPRPGHRGRPPVALSVRANAGYVIGLKLSDANHTGVIVDLAGRPVASASYPRRPHRATPEEIMGEATALITQLTDSADLPPRAILGVGLGLPGVVDHHTGTVHWSPIIQGQGTELAAQMTAHLGLPVAIDNDANLVTLAELWFGAGRDRADFAVVTIEHGVGMGLVVDHQLYRGANGLGMELGHTKVHLDGALCRCGQRGCLEAYVADYALVREATVALDLTPENPSMPGDLLDTLYDQAKAGNQAARTIFRRAGRFLALGLSNVVNLFDPSLVILAGERMRYDYLYAEDVLTAMKSLALSAGRAAPDVEINAWGDLVWARGAATLALEAATARLTEAPA